MDNTRSKIDTLLTNTPSVAITAEFEVLIDKIIAIVTQENKRAVIEAVGELIELQFGLAPQIYRNSRHVDEAIAQALEDTK